MTQIAMFTEEPKPQTKGMTFEQQSSFNKFWNYFAHKQGKVPAQRAWVKQWKHIKPVLGRVYRAALMTAKERATSPYSPKMAQGWINDHTWVDERFDKIIGPRLLCTLSEDEWRKMLGPNQKARWPFIHHHFRDKIGQAPKSIRKEYGFE